MEKQPRVLLVLGGGKANHDLQCWANTPQKLVDWVYPGFCETETSDCISAIFWGKEHDIYNLGTWPSPEGSSWSGFWWWPCGSASGGSGPTTGVLRHQRCNAEEGTEDPEGETTWNTYLHIFAPKMTHDVGDCPKAISHKPCLFPGPMPWGLKGLALAFRPSFRPRNAC